MPVIIVKCPSCGEEEERHVADTNYNHDSNDPFYKKHEHHTSSLIIRMVR